MANEEILNQIPSMDIEELWEMYNLLIEDKIAEPNEIRIVKYGKNINFDIRQYIRYEKGITTNIKMNPKSQIISIGNECYELSEFDDEIDHRKALMRKSLINYFGEENNPVEAR